MEKKLEALAGNMEEEKDELELVFECSSCHFVMTEENISYSDNTCPHCGSTFSVRGNLKQHVFFVIN